MMGEFTGWLQIGSYECARVLVILIDCLNSQHSGSYGQVEYAIYAVFIDSRSTSFQMQMRGSESGVGAPEGVAEWVYV